MIEGMKHEMIIALTFVIAAFAVPIQAVAAQEHAVADSTFLVGTMNQLRQNEGAPTSEPTVQSPSSSYFRDIPSISGHYSVGGRTWSPYLATGFSGGYSSELNRSLGGAPLTQIDLGFRNQFGQSVSPNEFQLGVRIPF
jgi:hypothetical protein